MGTRGIRLESFITLGRNLQNPKDVFYSYFLILFFILKNKKNKDNNLVLNILLKG